MDLRKDVLYYDALVDFPTIGQENKLYLDKSNGALYYWNGSSYALSGDGKGNVLSVTASAPLASSGGANPNITLSVPSDNTKFLDGSGAFDTVKDSDLSLSDITTNDVSTSKHGFAPKAPNDTTKFLRGDGTWAVPASGGLTKFTEAENTSAPNGTVYVDSLTAAASSTDADAAIVPKGAGALIAAVPNNLTSGGNKRGQYAVDWQMIRNANTQVASGNRSVILGGYNNISSGTYAISFGNTSSATNDYSIAIGQTAVSSGNNSISLGYANTASNTGSVSLGDSNTASGSRSVSLGQSNTASGGNDVSIGRLNIASGTDSVSIGTSNTNSGYGSQALGFSLNVTGTYAMALGNSSSASGLRGLAFGYNNGSSGTSSTTLGNSNLASAQDSMALGNRNTANGQNSLAYGFWAHTFGIAGRKSYASGKEATDGDSQYSKFVLHKRTTGNTATTLTTDSGAGGTANQVILSNQSAYRFKGSIVGKQSGSTNAAVWDIDGFIVRGANAAATTLNVSNVTLVQNTPAWGTPTLAADTTNGGLQVQVTGAAATNIQWTAVIETTEVIYA